MLAVLAGRGVDLAGVQVTDGATFRWKGEYGYDLNEARTLDTRLGVLADFKPDLPAHFRRCPYVFLANLVFAQRFSDVETSNTAFAANLLGAMVGGTLEYIALITGYHFLLIVIGVLYGFAFVIGRRLQRA